MLHYNNKLLMVIRFACVKKAGSDSLSVRANVLQPVGHGAIREDYVDELNNLINDEFTSWVTGRISLFDSSAIADLRIIERENTIDITIEQKHRRDLVSGRPSTAYQAALLSREKIKEYLSEFPAYWLAAHEKNRSVAPVIAPTPRALL